jgi:enoyl-CoA hydratase/carnithine racemase
MVVNLPDVLTASSLETLAETIESAGGPVILLGASDAVFCLGLGLSPDSDEDALAPFLRVVTALRAGPVAVAFVDGKARGGAVGLAAACDFVIASERADFALTELWFGLWPAAIYPLLVERLRPAAARWLALSGRTIGAQEARRLGLVDCEGGRAMADQAVAGCRRACPEAVVHFKACTAPLDAVATGASVTAQRLRHAEVRRRLSTFAEGLVPWG